MTSLLDAWRAVDPDARLASGSVERVGRTVRGVARTRATAPHIPDLAEGDLLVVDPQLLGAGGADALVAALGASAVEPAGIWVAATDRLEPAGSDLPILAGPMSSGALVDGLRRYLDAERVALAAVAADVRLAGAEAALADPEPAAPAGVLAARLRRGVAVSVDRALASLTPRPAGRALATRFAAAHARLLAAGAPRDGTQRRTTDGLWVLDRSIGPGATAWLFDDLPFAAVDEVALGSLAITLRALLRRRPAEPGRARAIPSLPPSSGDPLRDTLLAVARANGRIAPAARSLGVHRNTVLYRLRRAAGELGIDPRRPADALRLLQDAELRD